MLLVSFLGVSVWSPGSGWNRCVLPVVPSSSSSSSSSLIKVAVRKVEDLAASKPPSAARNSSSTATLRSSACGNGYRCYYLVSGSYSGGGAASGSGSGSRAGGVVTASDSSSSVCRKLVVALAGVNERYRDSWSGSGFAIERLLRKVLGDALSAAAGPSSVRRLLESLHRFQEDELRRLTLQQRNFSAQSGQLEGQSRLRKSLQEKSSSSATTALAPASLPLEGEAFERQLSGIDWREGEVAFEELHSLEHGVGKAASKKNSAILEKSSAAGDEGGQVPEQHGAPSSAWDLSIFAPLSPQSIGNASSLGSNLSPQLQPPSTLSPVHEHEHEYQRECEGRQEEDRSPKQSSSHYQVLSPSPQPSSSLPLPREITASAAVSEDLTLVYKGNTLQKCAVEGRVKVKTCPIRYTLKLRDENSNIVEVEPHQKHCTLISAQSARLFICDAREDRAEGGDIAGTRAGALGPVWVDVLKYICASSLKPFPVRIRSRVLRESGVTRDGGGISARIQVGANPSLPSALLGITVTVKVAPIFGMQPTFIPENVEWDATKRIARWRFPSMQSGAKLNLQIECDSGSGSGDLCAGQRDDERVPESIPVNFLAHSNNASFSGAGLSLENPELPANGPSEFKTSCLSRLAINLTLF